MYPEKSPLFENCQPLWKLWNFWQDSQILCWFIFLLEFSFWSINFDIFIYQTVASSRLKIKMRMHFFWNNPMGLVESLIPHSAAKCSSQPDWFSNLQSRFWDQIFGKSITSGGVFAPSDIYVELQDQWNGPYFFLKKSYVSPRCPKLPDFFSQLKFSHNIYMS